MSDPRYTVLAGGVGAARFLEGLVQVVPPEAVTAIVNTGDDAEFFGLYVSPDLDIVTYTLAGIIDPEHGWGIEGDSFNCLSMLGSFGHPTWFNLGDTDIAAHIHRTLRMSEGRTLAEVTDEITTALNVGIKIIPMTNNKVRTIIDNGEEKLAFQEYFVQRRAEDLVRRILFEGIEDASPAPGVLESLEASDAVIIAPSNPFVSIGTILSVPGVRRTLTGKTEEKKTERRNAVRNTDQTHSLGPTKPPVVAVSPIVGGAAVKGPAAAMLESLGHEVSAVGVARLYRDFLDVMVIDEKDIHLKGRIEELGIKVIATDTIMDSPGKKKALARFVLGCVK